ncbi:hypothetical protein GQ600_23705 [Phytophthora cactorum]|nr:hypothetical protein GQ600_23705 [Phytophthora cactorum]
MASSNEGDTNTGTNDNGGRDTKNDSGVDSNEHDTSADTNDNGGGDTKNDGGNWIGYKTFIMFNNGVDPRVPALPACEPPEPIVPSCRVPKKVISEMVITGAMKEKMEGEQSTH